MDRASSSMMGWRRNPRKLARNRKPTTRSPSASVKRGALIIRDLLRLVSNGNLILRTTELLVDEAMNIGTHQERSASSSLFFQSLHSHSLLPSSTSTIRRSTFKIAKNVLTIALNVLD